MAQLVWVGLEQSVSGNPIRAPLMNGGTLLSELQGQANILPEGYESLQVQTFEQVVVHEMGHNLGMSHDFDNKHAGKGCDGTGFMSYGSPPDQWSTCSKSDLLEHYNTVLNYAAQFSSVSWCVTSNNLENTRGTS